MSECKELNSINSELESFAKLLQAMQDDPIINNKVISLLKMDLYPRRIVLNNWLERLHQQNAPKKLTQALSCLFDDNVSEKVLALINNHLTNCGGVL